MDILLASNNDHKQEEFSRLLAPHRILMPKDLGIAFDVEEDRSSFTENALLKATTLKALAPEYRILGDDSGLCVDALDGGPGLQTARYGFDVHNHLMDSKERNAYLLKHMEGVEDRSARFVCALALVVDDHRVYTVCEEAKGSIARHERGSEGFGYDPIFIVDGEGLTMAELGMEAKDELGHRGKASRILMEIIGRI
ncbi:MAG: non-canonical purine NTP pyrophosphatase [Spirochaetales bacterium]|nr:non-canonical purine NTP pyrophosphatase [Spirochaetales bacterium]